MSSMQEHIQNLEGMLQSKEKDLGNFEGLLQSKEKNMNLLKNLKNLLKNLKNLKCVVGSEEDKVSICSGVEQCSKFCRDILETTECQNSEIFALRTSTLETFSWLEEAVARDRSGVEHKYQQLLRARARQFNVVSL